jgi:hypothetical protein
MRRRRPPEEYRAFHDLLRRWRLTAAAHSEPGFEARLGGVREAPLDLTESARAVAVHRNVIVTVDGADIAVHQPMVSRFFKRNILLSGINVLDAPGAGNSAISIESESEELLGAHLVAGHLP